MPAHRAPCSWATSALFSVAYLEVRRGATFAVRRGATFLEVRRGSSRCDVWGFVVVWRLGWGAGFVFLTWESQLNWRIH